VIPLHRWRIVRGGRFLSILAALFGGFLKRRALAFPVDP
jgi:hypothetical protein